MYGILHSFASSAILCMFNQASLDRTRQAQKVDAIAIERKLVLAFLLKAKSEYPVF